MQVSSLNHIIISYQGFHKTEFSLSGTSGFAIFPNQSTLWKWVSRHTGRQLKTGKCKSSSFIPCMADQDTQVKCFLPVSTCGNDDTLCKQMKSPCPRFVKVSQVLLLLTDASCEERDPADSVLCWSHLSRPHVYNDSSQSFPSKFYM